MENLIYQISNIKYQLFQQYFSLKFSNLDLLMLQVNELNLTK